LLESLGFSFPYLKLKTQEDQSKKGDFALGGKECGKIKSSGDDQGFRGRSIRNACGSTTDRLTTTEFYLHLSSEDAIREFLNKW